jgi:3-oxoacyl-[acyl-carrier protein] reductase
MLEGRLGLRDRVVVVAGAGGGGIGTAICDLLASAGATVAAIDNDADALKAVTSPHVPLLADVRDEEQVGAAVTEAARLGSVHGLVHVAGGLPTDSWGSLLATSLDNFDAVVRLNLHSAFVTSRAVAALLVEQGPAAASCTSGR